VGLLAPKRVLGLCPAGEWKAIGDGAWQLLDLRTERSAGVLP
jgi:hypothetical protein